MAERIVTQVKPKRKLLSFPELILQKRVAAYAHVSSDSDEQLNSVEARKDYFEKLIKERPDWVFVGVYADEGITGTNTKKREGFNRMIDDALSGKIDLIVTKSVSPFAGKLICGDCGEIFGAKLWHSNTKYRRTIWQCNGKFKGEKKCTTPHLYEDDIKDSFITALSTLLSDREKLLKDGRLILAELEDNTAIDTECDNFIEEMDVLSAHTQKCVIDNAVQAADQDEYISRYTAWMNAMKIYRAVIMTCKRKKSEG